MKMKSIIICFCFSCLGFWWHMLSAQEQARALRPLEQCTLVTDLADYYKMPIYLCESGKFFYFTCCGPQAVAYNFLYARGKDSGIYWKADPDLEIHFLSADEDYFYALIEPVPEEVVRETQDPLLRQIFKQFALSLGEKTSARLVKVKFK